MNHKEIYLINNIKSIFLFSFLVINFNLSHSQNNILIDTSDYDKRQLLKLEITERFNAKKEILKKQYKSKLRTEVLNYLEATEEEIQLLISKKRFIFDERYLKFSDSLLQQLVNTNEELKQKKYKILISKEPIANAFSIGNGLIVLHVGLFSTLETSEQLLSVIAHEIAHDYLNHFDNAIISKAKTRIELTSRKSKSSKKVRKSKYRKGTISFEILKNIIYINSQFQQMKEIEADSMGYHFFRNTTLKNNEFANTLKLLSKHDILNEKQVSYETLQNVFFNHKTLFPKIDKELKDYEKYNYSEFKEQFNRDSLKTHPETEDRLRILKSTYTISSNFNHYPTDANHAFLKLKQISSEAIIENLFHTNDLGIGLYHILHIIQNDYKDTNRSYTQFWLSTYLKALSKAKKNYTFNRFVKQINTQEQNNEYQQFLALLWDLNISDLDFYSQYYSTINQD